jgi:hypothetical protein
VGSRLVADGADPGQVLMGEKSKILIQLDCDPHPSVFDRVVAVDAGAQHVFSYGGVEPRAVRDLVHGAIFTRGGDSLKSTAIFIGGSRVDRCEEILAAVRKSFFGPMRVSVLLDPSGANTTAAAAVAVASRHASVAGAQALVLGSTGPVGRRVARLLARSGASVRAASRSIDRSQEVAEQVRAVLPAAQVTAVATSDPASLERALDGIDVVVSAGGPGARLLPLAARQAARKLKVAVDLNAVPPEGIEGVQAMDAGVERDGAVVYGAIGVGGLKMKVHKAALARLFESKGLVLDVDEVYEVARALVA